MAAAAALRLARADPSRRVLLLSTDPAHSLGDVFKTRRSAIARTRFPAARETCIVRELDAPAALAARRTQLESALDEIASAVGASRRRSATAACPCTAGVRIGRELMDLAPPGIDELFGIISVVDARADYDVIVVDTAPTGHALRLLEMPDAAREWVQVLLRVLLKYRSLVRPGQLAASSSRSRSRSASCRSCCATPAQTRFIVVTRAAEVPRRETERLLTRLRRCSLATPAVVVNAMTLAPGRCPRCRATAAAERRELARTATRPARVRYHPDAAAAPPPRGVRALERWAGHGLRSVGPRAEGSLRH